MKHQSIKCYLSAARHLQIMSGQGDPLREKMPLLEYVLRGIKSEQAKRFPTAQRVWLPITPDVLVRIRRVWERHCKDPDNTMLWAACTTCFLGFLRSGGITVPSLRDFDPGAHLCVGDVTLDTRSAPRIAQLNIKASKTDCYSIPVTNRPIPARGVNLPGEDWQSVVSSSSIGSIFGNSWEPAGALLPVQRRSPTITRTVCHQSQRGVDGGGAGCVQVRRTQL